MLKLVVVSGPNRGASFPLNSGETSIGRQMGNVIVLPSNRVSKKHCVLEVEGERVALKDLGSANGTFVNGVLTKGRELTPGSRISIGEFVFELVRPGARPPRPGGSGTGLIQNNVIPFPQGGGFPAQHMGQTAAGGFGLPMGMPAGGMGQPLPQMGAPAAPEPKNLFEKLRFIFDHRLMPALFGMLQSNEWRMMGVILVAVFVAVSTLFVVQPLTGRSDELIRKELMKRTRFMAKLLVNQNAPFLIKGDRNRVDVGTVESEPGIKYAVVVDLEGNIIAPISRAGQPFTSGNEASFANAFLKKARREGDESGGSAHLEGGNIVASIEPFKVVNPRLSRNEVIAIALVSADATLAVPGFSEGSIDYLETGLYLGALGLMLGFVFYRLTLRPFQILNEDIDKVLKGEQAEVSHEYKLSELDSLWEVVNQALQQIPKRNAGDGGGGLSSLVNPLDQYLGPMRSMLPLASFGMVLLDDARRVVSMNQVFSELSGIRADQAEGQELASQGRDQSFGEFVNDLCNRAPVGGEGVNENYDFSGIPHRVTVAAFGNPGTPAKCFIFCAVKAEG